MSSRAQLLLPADMNFDYIPNLDSWPDLLPVHINSTISAETTTRAASNSAFLATGSPTELVPQYSYHGDEVLTYSTFLESTTFN